MPKLVKHITLLFSIASIINAQIIQSKHNFSVTGTGTIKSNMEQEVCKFCHLPHRNLKVRQLWDHTLSSVSYNQYTSSTLTSTYLAQYPNTSSKLCLSCHDGTIAIGSMSTGQINVSGSSNLDADQSLSASAASNLGGASGTTLSDDHPISIGLPHFNSSQYNCSGCHYPRPSDKVPMECVRCHDPHNESKDGVTKKFLKKSNSSSALCLDCHNKKYWSTNPSGHQSSTKTLPLNWSHNGYTTVTTSGCESCHKPHSAGSPSRLLKLSEQNLCEGCHKGIANGGITTKNVSSATGGPFAKLYTHPTYTVDNKHNPVNANPVTNSPTESSASVSNPNRHAECSDCHNPHGAFAGLHTPKSNLVSNVLNGVWGLEPVDGTKWTQPTSFTRIDPSTKEYQICLKCHSYYGLGSTTNGVTTIIGPSGTNITDQAMEYNVNNFSAHPVKVGLNSQTGSYAPKALTTGQMSTSWNSVGSQTMYCSDCHGNDAVTSSTVPQGPHGSNNRFMLQGTSSKPNAKYWPANASGALWTLKDLLNNTNNWSSDLFCVGCHPIKNGTTFISEAHGEHNDRSVTIGGKYYSGVPCVACHAAVPHGAKRSRLIAYSTDPSPYNYLDGAVSVAIVRGYKKAAGPNSYSKANCYSTNSGCTTHSNQGGYDQ